MRFVVGISVRFLGLNLRSHAISQRFSYFFFVVPNRFHAVFLIKVGLILISKRFN